jgi:deazaflavin-dependent oxidoreductase (nitroreductase family)
LFANAQKNRGMMTYPSQGTFNHLFFRAPLFFWRTGLGPLIGQTMLVLTTRGRKSGRPRHTMVSYTQVGGKLYIASGWGQQAQWYRNVVADPHVSVQAGRETFSALARRVEDPDEFTLVMQHMLATGGDVYFRPWLESLGIELNLDSILANQQKIYLVALDRTIQPGPLPLQADLRWFWPLLALVFAAGWLSGRLSR